AGSAAGPQGDDFVVEGIFDVTGCCTRGIGTNQIELADSHRMHGVVVIDRDRLSGHRLEFDDSYGLVGRPLVVWAFPPAAGFGVDDIAIDIYVRDAGSIACARGLQLLFCDAYGFDNLLCIGASRLRRSAV